MNFVAIAVAFVRRHRATLILATSAAVVLLADHVFAGAAIRGMGMQLWIAARARFDAATDPEPWLALLALTIFLAFANLYLKIALQAPGLQRRLRPAVFFNMSFTIYCSVYLLISVLAFNVLRGNTDNSFVAVVTASLIGIGLGNADVKFGGISLLPLAEFLQGLEGVVQVGIGVELSELDVAKRARLRDDLAGVVPLDVLYRECRILGVEDAALETIRDFDDVGTQAGMLAREIVTQSEANARRIIDDWWQRPRQ